MESMMTIIPEQPPSFEEAARIHPNVVRLGLGYMDADHGENLGMSYANYMGRRATVAGPLADLLENEEDQDEEELPPEYEDGDNPSRLPGYEERHLLAPVVSYNVYQISRKLQVLTPATRECFQRPRYRITAKSSIFSRKADYTLTRLPTGAAAAAEKTPGKEVGLITFDRAGQIPWMPRATVQIFSENPTTAHRSKWISYDMTAGNFSDWKFAFHGETYYWRLTDKPTALSLYEMTSESIVARFTYSKHGTDATRGAEVGVLDIYGGSRSEDLETIEVMLCTCQVPVVHWRNMGRHYRNDVVPRLCSVRGGGVGLGNSLLAADARFDGVSRMRRTNSAV